MPYITDGILTAEKVVLSGFLTHCAKKIFILFRFPIAFPGESIV